LLAAILLKLGTSAFYRIIIIFSFNNFFVWVLIRFFGLTAGVSNCFLQRDSKSFLAYRSVIHINFLFFILLVLNNYVKTSSFLIIISHGFVSRIIFFFIGEFYKMESTRFIFYFKNLVLSSIFFLYLIIFCILGNRAVPFSLSFFLEFIGVWGGFLFLIFSFIILGFYFFFSFYASFYFLIRGITGKKVSFYRNLNILYFYFFRILSYFFFIFLFLISVYILKKI
jgi:NADH-quinone oxidoreductase subunit M